MSLIIKAENPWRFPLCELNRKKVVRLQNNVEEFFHEGSI